MRKIGATLLVTLVVNFCGVTTSAQAPCGAEVTSAKVTVEVAAYDTEVEAEISVQGVGKSILPSYVCIEPFIVWCTSKSICLCVGSAAVVPVVLPAVCGADATLGIKDRRIQIITKTAIPNKAMPPALLLSIV